MNKLELKTILGSIKEDKRFIDKCKKAYGNLPDVVIKLLSYNDNNRFIESWRVVSESEVLNPIEVIHVDFRGENIIPVINVMDNDYLCYDLEKKRWTMYNIVDNVKFDPRKEIYDYIQ